MKFFSKEIQEALINGKTINVKNNKHNHYSLDNEGNMQCKHVNNEHFLSTNRIDQFTDRDWEVVEEPKYEYLWVVEPKPFEYRVLTHKYYKTEEDVEKFYPESIILERCEWSKREIK